MLSPRQANRHAGFTLIELMIGIVILGILAAAAIPSFQAWINNTQVRNAAEAVTDGIQRARSEAVSRNTNVAFTLGTDTSWRVSVVTPASGIASRPSIEGSKNVTRTVLPANAVTGAGTASITFNNLGGIQPLNADGTAPISQIDFALTGANIPLRVTIGIGGNARLCDPAAPAGSTRAC
jgi:type IV fimbrial biogenesis protein FimT